MLTYKIGIYNGHSDKSWLNIGVIQNVNSETLNSIKHALLCYVEIDLRVIL